MVQVGERVGVGMGEAIELGVCQPATGQLSVSPSVNGFLFRMQRKEEDWIPPFIFCAQNTMGVYLPLPLRPLDYGKPLPFLHLR